MAIDRSLLKHIDFINFKSSMVNHSYIYHIDIALEVPKVDLIRMPKDFVEHMHEAISNTILKHIDFKDFIIENMQGLA